MTTNQTVRKGYKPCRSCGATRVVIWTYPSLTKGREGVVAECAGCGNRRGSWERKIKNTES